MSIIDGAIFVAVIWGGIAGSMAGIRAMLFRLLLLLTSVLMSALLSSHIAVYMSDELFFADVVREVFLRDGYIIPVSGPLFPSGLCPEIVLPEEIPLTLREYILMRLNCLPRVCWLQLHYEIADIMTDVIINTAVFTAAFIFFQVGADIAVAVAARIKQPESILSPVCGAMIGCVNIYILSILILGIISTFLWRFPITANVLNLQHSLLGSSGLEFLRIFGIWSVGQI